MAMLSQVLPITASLIPSFQCCKSRSLGLSNKLTPLSWRTPGRSHVRAPSSSAPLKKGFSNLGPGTIRDRGSEQVQQAVFGVGAPEAILVGIVALVVFGPKGLAEAAKSLGKTVKSFQPTLRELAEVSTDLRSTLEEEIGLDEIKSDFNSIRNPLPPSRRVSNTVQGSVDTLGGEEQLKKMDENSARAVDPEIDIKRAESINSAWGGEPPVQPKVVEAESSSSELTGLSGLSTRELEEELARRSKSDKA